jgi:TonB family protein
VALCFVAPSALSAQDVAGSTTVATVTGAVVDVTHAPMARVAVTFEDEDRQLTHRFVTDGQGRLPAIPLPPGTYLVEARVRGFAPYAERLVVAAPTVEREIVLEPDEITESLTVVGGEASQPGDVRTRGPEDACELPIDADTRSPIGGQLRPPRMLAHPRPRYPEHLRVADLDGRVQLRGRIGIDGRLADVQVVEGAHPDFAAAAEDAVRQWTWEEARLNCEPVEISVTISVQFVP